MLTTALALMPAAGNAEILPVFHMVGENQSGLVFAPDGQTLYYTTAPIGKRATINSTNWPQLRSSLRAGNTPM